MKAKRNYGRVTAKGNALIITGTLADALRATAARSEQDVEQTAEERIAGAIHERLGYPDQDIIVTVTLPKESNAAHVVRSLRALSTANDSQIVEAWLLHEGPGIDTDSGGELIWALAVKADEHKEKQESAVKKAKKKAPTPIQTTIDQSHRAPSVQILGADLAENLRFNGQIITLPPDVCAAVEDIAQEYKTATGGLESAHAAILTDGVLADYLLPLVPVATEDQQVTVTVKAGSFLSRLLALARSLEPEVSASTVLEAALQSHTEFAENQEEFVIPFVTGARDLHDEQKEGAH